jgi:hypothetical protein
MAGLIETVDHRPSKARKTRVEQPVDVFAISMQVETFLEFLPRESR